MNEPITGDQHVISAGRYRAVVTELGGGLRELSCDGRPLTIPYDAGELPPGAGGQLLAPWPNRIDHGRYDFGGESYRLTVDEPGRGTAIHGLVRWVPWALAEAEPHRVRLTYRLLGRPGYPFRLDLSVEYALDAGGGLTVRQSARNTGPRTAPYGHGAHPYLTVGLPLDECDLTAPATRYLEIDARAIPERKTRAVAGTPYDFGERRRIGATEVNNAYTELRRDSGGRAWVRLSGGGRSVALWVDEAHPWLELYTRDEIDDGSRRMGLGTEPMTCPPNAFATGTDVIALEPGEEFAASWGIIAE